ncbi:MAG: SRPBCC family protein [Chloroflexota bacterium]|nr:SRPBCC family protein [Chloroflexota bacterium]
MPSARHSVVIDRSVHDVYTYVADGTTAPAWRESVKDIKLVSGIPGAVGARYEQGMKGPGGRIPADYEIVEAVPDRLLAFQVVAGPARPRGRYEFEQAGGGTRVTFSLDWEPKGIKEKLMAPLVARTMPKEVATLDDLKRVLETIRPMA